MKNLIAVFFISGCSTVSAGNIESEFFCDSYELDCAKSMLDKTISEKDFSRLDQVIDLIMYVDTTKPLRDNLLGVAHMFKQDPSSLSESEKFLKSSLKSGVNEAAQNLAELYFLKDDYQNTVKYLNMVNSFNYEFPDKKYVNWARLHAQVAYLFKADGNSVKKALGLFREIQHVDKSGTAEYFLGHYELNKEGDVDAGIALLDRAIQKENLTAMLLLADTFYFGEKIAANIEKAKTHYLMAGEHGSGRAYFNLAVISQSENDVSSMKGYLTKSANLRDPKAIELYRKLTEPDQTGQSN
ncbi:MAG: TPR repeat protein [Paraglaciecola sp.]|jgi:TPR repeat protein